MNDRCWMLPYCFRELAAGHPPRVEVVYVYVANNQSYHSQAINFIESYQKNPPGAEHKTTIVCNGGEPPDGLREAFHLLQNVSFMAHDNSGFDIGGFQHAARQSSADLMLFLGASTYFCGPGWLNRVIQSFQAHGDALYGAMGNRGDPGVRVNRHIRTTGFWMTPHLLNQYPITVTQLEQRYEFEHRTNCLTEWCIRNGKRAWVVSWDGEYLWTDWDRIKNGYRRGDQSNLIFGDHLTTPPFYVPKARQK